VEALQRRLGEGGVEPLGMGLDLGQLGQGRKTTEQKSPIGPIRR
jgi:hypothetical protein